MASSVNFQHSLRARTPRARLGFTFVELVVVITVIAALAAIGFPIYKSVRKQADVSATESVINAVAAAMSAYQLKTWTWYENPRNPQPTEKRTYHIFDLNHFNESGERNPDIRKNGGPFEFYSIDGYTPGSRSEHDPSYKKAILAKDVNDARFIKPHTQKWDERNNPWDKATRGNTRTFDSNIPPAAVIGGYTGFMNMAGASLALHPRFIDKRGILRDAWGEPLRIWFYPRIFGSDSFGIWSKGNDKWDKIFQDVDMNVIAADLDDELRKMNMEKDVKNDDIASWK
jgi:prepilin-type N-terminal cleavage/methylation domain-containing protein